MFGIRDGLTERYIKRLRMEKENAGSRPSDEPSFAGVPLVILRKLAPRRTLLVPALDAPHREDRARDHPLHQRPGPRLPHGGQPPREPGSDPRGGTASATCSRASARAWRCWPTPRRRRWCRWTTSPTSPAATSRAAAATERHSPRAADDAPQPAARDGALETARRALLTRFRLEPDLPVP